MFGDRCVEDVLQRGIDTIAEFLPGVQRVRRV